MVQQPVDGRPSTIAGQGVFAREPIAEGAPVPDASAANHSCDPNLWWSGDALVAMRDIGVGEELTYDYATGTTGGPLPAGFLLRCNCGSTRCRGMVEPDDWRIGELRRRYDEHFAPELRRIMAEIEAGRIGP